MALQFSNSIDEELIAAYVDGDVSAEERQRVEAAMAVNEQIAWEVNTLRQTVELLHDMPRVALPRSFVLTEDQVKDVVQARRSHARVPPAVEVEAPAESAWQRLLEFLYGGNPVFRNAAALAAVLLLLVIVAEIPLQQSQFNSRSAANGQLTGAPSTPQIQVTVVGEPFSRTAGAESKEPATGEQVGRQGRCFGPGERGVLIRLWRIEQRRGRHGNRRSDAAARCQGYGGICEQRRLDK